MENIKEKNGMDLLIFFEYQLGDIEKYLKAIKKIGKDSEEVVTSIKDEEYLNFLNEVLPSMRSHSRLLETKKIQNNKADLIKLGEDIKHLGQLMVDYGNKHKDNKVEDKNRHDSLDEKLDKIFDKMLEDILEDFD